MIDIRINYEYIFVKELKSREIHFKWHHKANAPTLSLGISFKSLPYLRKTFNEGWSGVIPTSSIDKIALVVTSTLNYLQAYCITAVKGASYGTDNVL